MILLTIISRFIHNQLFNGNISQSTLSLSKFSNGLPVGYSYGYDQLNRLTGMRQHNIASGQSSWSNSNIINDYKENIAYDANGNILKYLRNGTTQGSNPIGMDSLTYLYNANTNQLNTIHDSIPAGNYANDLDNQSANNYAYDSIGNLIKDNAGSITNVNWTVYGKVKQVTKGSNTVQFNYDASGNRIIKNVTGTNADKQFYVRDAQGNILSIYSYNGSSLKWAEQDLYGSNRIGTWDWNQAIPNRVMLPQSETDTLSDWYLLGSRDYELTNHLSNVLSVITDKKVGISSGGSIVDYYKAEVLSQNDYYPFGMQMPGRTYGLSSYRFGFNGKENDKEVLGWQNYGMREYDVLTGRFIGVDPLISKYPELSPYQFASNSSISGIDLDGLEYISFHHYANGAVTKTEMYKMTDKEVKRLGGTTSGLYNSVPYGPGGKGIVHYYYNSNGDITRTLWEQHQTNWKSDLTYHGLYSGPGSVTHDGNPQSTDYDFNEQPIDWADAIAKRHDMDYAKATAHGEKYAGYLEDLRTLQADKNMVARLDKLITEDLIPLKTLSVEGVETPVRTSRSGEMEATMYGQRILINALATYKQWKIDNGKKNADLYKDNRKAFSKAHPVVAKIIDQLPN